MQRVTMSPPWQIFYSKIKAMFWDEELQGEIDYKCRRTKDRYE